MSLEFNDSPYCKGKTCTNLLSNKADYDVGHCYLCYQDILDSKVKREYNYQDSEKIIFKLSKFTKVKG